MNPKNLPFGENRMCIDAIPTKLPTKCSMCGETFPTDQKYFLIEDKKPVQPCLLCIETMPLREKLDTIRDASTRIAFAQAAGALESPQLSDLYTSLIRKLGGVEAITDVWASAIENIKDDPFRVKTLLDQMNKIANMAVTVQDQGRQGADKLSDEELEYEAQLIAARRMPRIVTES